MLRRSENLRVAKTWSPLLRGEMSDVANQLKAKGFSDERIDELIEEAFYNRNYSELEEALGRDTKASGGSMDASMDERNTWQEGGSIDDQMKAALNMLPDDEMEDNYLDFIINEALSEEEEDMLMSKLEQDEELSMLFDKVIEVASEFAGSGPVEGPGTGVSDSIPARLSDGEFVFTAKAVEEIGADNLMAMMKEAEMKADERQGMANGGTMEEEDQPEPVVVAEQAPVRQDIRVTKQTVGPQASVQEERDLIDEEIKKGMLSSRPYVRS